MSGTSGSSVYLVGYTHRSAEPYRAGLCAACRDAVILYTERDLTHPTTITKHVPALVLAQSILSLVGLTYALTHFRT